MFVVVDSDIDELVDRMPAGVITNEISSPKMCFHEP